MTKQAPLALSKLLRFIEKEKKPDPQYSSKLDLITITPPGQDPLNSILKYAYEGDSPEKNEKARIFGFSEEIALPTLDGKLVSRARKKDIDWEKINKRVAWVNTEEIEDGFIHTWERYKAYPRAFIDKNGQMYLDEDMPVDANMSNYLDKSYRLFQETWDKSLSKAKPDDLFTHWGIRYKS